MKYQVIFVFLTGIMVTPAFSQAERKYIRKGNREYQEKQYEDAEILYRKALEKDENSDKAGYNLGNSLYKQDKFAASSARYEDLALRGNKDKKEVSKYFYNLGNSYFKENNFKESIEAYKNALRNNPADVDAKHNLQVAMNMLNNQQQQQQKNQQQKQDQQQQDKQNQQQQQQPQQSDQKNQQQQQKQQQISREDAERLLDEIAREEKDVLKKVQQEKKKTKKVPVEKNW